ncbi:MAG: hypothetical protein ACOCT0_05350, partial [Halobacteriota archaeon]
MHSRRRFVAASGLALSTGVAGCLNPPDEEPGDNDTDPADNDTDDNDTDGNDTDGNETDVDEGEAEIELVSMSAPSEVVLNEGFRVEIEVENTGDAEGVFSTEARWRYAWGDWQFRDISIEIPAGETVVHESQLYDIAYLDAFEYVLPEYDEEVEVVATRPELEPDGFYTTPEGVTLEATEVDVRSRYRYHDDDAIRQRATGEYLTRWAHVRVRATNESGRRRDMPTYEEFTVQVRGDDSEAVEDEAVVDGYVPRRFSDGTTVEGWMVFEVPRDTSRDEVSLTWENDYEQGDAAARWTGFR